MQRQLLENIKMHVESKLQIYPCMQDNIDNFVLSFRLLIVP